MPVLETCGGDLTRWFAEIVRLALAGRSQADIDAAKIANKHPWVKELYNQHSRDKAAFQQRYQRLNPGNKEAFKHFCSLVQLHLT